MARTVRTYASDTVEVRWEPGLCIHTGICLRELPSVFDTDDLPWIQVDGADADAVLRAVALCPTGALAARPLPDGVNPYEPDGQEPLSFKPHEDGPLYVRGEFETPAADDGSTRRCSRAAICTCGATSNAPFCDNAHRRVKRMADAESGPVMEADEEEGTPAP